MLKLNLTVIRGSFRDLQSDKTFFEWQGKDAFTIKTQISKYFLAENL